MGYLVAAYGFGSETHRKSLLPLGLFTLVSPNADKNMRCGKRVGLYIEIMTRDVLVF